ncbi:MAG: hypothetical protein QGG48_07770 [Desulfatiglandales bacterium]|jgi:hypothetical protein|nr:hypothetical protein [Desulfatiglandales bacterium]
MDLVIFEQNKPLVFEALGNVEFDDIGSASEVFETEFFRFIKAKAILDKFAETCPSTRKKEMVPLWFYVAGNISMRLHGVHSFNAFPLVVRSGGFLNVLGPKGLRRSHIRIRKMPLLPVRGSTRKITMTAGLPAIRIFCINWPRTQSPMP